jgi:hypothetical protein
MLGQRTSDRARIFSCANQGDRFRRKDGIERLGPVALQNVMGWIGFDGERHASAWLGRGSLEK